MQHRQDPYSSLDPRMPVGEIVGEGLLVHGIGSKKERDEQVRDTILQVSGNLDDGLGGPSQDLTPDYKRRTIYGKVSRYKLDAFLQLFDFPSPNISAEKRFTTTVPLHSQLVQMGVE